MFFKSYNEPWGYDSYSTDWIALGKEGSGWSFSQISHLLENNLLINHWWGTAVMCVHIIVKCIPCAPTHVRKRLLSVDSENWQSSPYEVQCIILESWHCHATLALFYQNTSQKFAQNNGDDLCSLDVTKNVCVSRDPSARQKRLFKMPAQWMSHLLRGHDYSVHFSSSCLHFQLLQERRFL